MIDIHELIGPYLMRTLYTILQVPIFAVSSLQGTNGPSPMCPLFGGFAVL